jgi:hypothetical protein
MEPKSEIAILRERIAELVKQQEEYEYNASCIISTKDKRIAELENENYALAAWQCPYTDGKEGLVCDEHGHQHCAKNDRIAELEKDADTNAKPNALLHYENNWKR